MRGETRASRNNLTKEAINVTGIGHVTRQSTKAMNECTSKRRSYKNKRIYRTDSGNAIVNVGCTYVGVYEVKGQPKVKVVVIRLLQ